MSANVSQDPAQRGRARKKAPKKAVAKSAKRSSRPNQGPIRAERRRQRSAAKVPSGTQRKKSRQQEARIEAAAEDHSHHVDYAKIYRWLIILFVISVAGPLLGFKWLTILTAFGIAIVKASLVANYFMHLKFEKQYIWLVMLTCLLFLFVLFSFVAPDILNASGTNWDNVREKPTHPVSEQVIVAQPTPDEEGGDFE